MYGIDWLLIEHWLQGDIVSIRILLHESALFIIRTSTAVDTTLISEPSQAIVC
jgi:hypothetical protein